MKMAVIGMGVAGLTTAAGFAELGHSVKCVDIDAGTAAVLTRGAVAFSEPGLQELVSRNAEAGRLVFGAGADGLLADADVLFLAADTPCDLHGDLQMAPLWAAVDRVEPWNETGGPGKIVIVVSSVPVGTADRIEARLRARLPGQCRVDVASVPEFMAEGSAVRDFFEPSRVVIGASGGDIAGRVELLYRRLSCAILKTDRRSAELAKLAASAFLAVKMSFANEVAALAEQTGADYPEVAGALGLDPRIAPFALGAGLGFGGASLPKDTRAFVRVAEECGAPQTLVGAAIRTNAMQPLRMVRKLEAALSEPGRRKVALLGLAFRPGTDDMREAPSVRLAAELVRRHPGITLTAYDPAAGASARSALPKAVHHFGSAEEALRGADAAILVTEWPEFRKIRAEHFKNWMNRPIILDGRNALDSHALNAQGVICIGMGRLPAVPPEPIRLPGEPVPNL